MTTPGRYAASDGSFAKSAGSAAARGGILIGIAVVIGFLLLWQGFDGGDSSADAGGGVADDSGGDGVTPTTVPPDDGGDDGSGGDDGGDAPDPTEPTDPGDTTPTTVDPGVDVDPPSEVQVAVLNGTGVGGLAGERRDALTAAGYVATAANYVGGSEDSWVYYRDGYSDEAKEVAEALSGPAGVVAAAPADINDRSDKPEEAAAANIIVVLGSDEALS